jgi:predicted Zn-ribbon and HTH transcriptional regulator
MIDTEWVPNGVDIETLRAQERELRARLEKIRDVLQAISGKKAARRGRSADSGSTRLSLIVQVLQQSQVPLSVREIYERLRALDPHLNWTNPAPVFRSYIRRQPDDSQERVVLIQRGLYGIRGKHTAAAKPDAAPQLGLDPERRLRRGAITSAVRDILRESHDPLAIAEILTRLRAQGVEQRAQDPRASLSVLLRRSPDFVRVDPGKFRLSEDQSGDGGGKAGRR